MYLYYTNIIPHKPAAVKGVSKIIEIKIGYLMGHVITVLNMQQVTSKYDFVYLTVLNSAKEKRRQIIVPPPFSFRDCGYLRLSANSNPLACPQ